jgi:hypothetical protein
MLFALTLLFVSSCAKSAAPLHPDLDAELLRLSSLSESELPDVLSNLDREDEIASYYRDPATRERVVSFFGELTHSKSVAVSILDSAERAGVPESLAFALAFEESRFRPQAVNTNAASVDKGLFQLNSKTFPRLSEAEFFDPEVNARHGMDHLAYCLKSGGNEVAALAMYNAGQGRVSGNGTPKVTLDYIYRIMKYQENIGSLFAARVVAADNLRIASIGRK